MVRPGDEPVHALGKREHGEGHVLHRRPNERDPILIAAEHELLEIGLNRAHWRHRRIEGRAQPEQQEDRPLQQYPILRNLEGTRQLAERDVELTQIGKHLRFGADIHLNVTQAERLERHLLEKAALEILDDPLGDVFLVRRAAVELDVSDEPHAPQRTRDFPGIPLDHAL